MLVVGSSVHMQMFLQGKFLGGSFQGKRHVHFKIFDSGVGVGDKFSRTLLVGM